MPKNYPKTYPKKAKPKKTKFKDQPKPVNLLRRKSYWITLISIILVFTFAYGYITEISLAKEALIVSSILVMIGFAFYLGFKPLSYNKRVTAIFVGASVIGFCIWAAMVFSFSAAGINTQIASSVGADVFAVTSLIICLIAGGLIGDLIGKNREAIALFVGKFRK
jgi:lysylphosphatidylglycerol synthetase-like protein (DUF2156 family)